jgi:hypothetical protein
LIYEQHQLFFSLKMITNICFEQICGNYWYGQYGSFKVIMMKDCGYINATKLCRDGGKRFHDWKRLQHSIELLDITERFVASENTHGGAPRSPSSTCGPRLTGIPAGRDNTLKTVSGDCFSEVGCIISGTYCHSILIPHVASWVSSEFAIKVSKIVNDYFISDYKIKLEVAHQEAILKDVEIENLREGLMEMDTARMRLEEDLTDMDAKHTVVT